MASLVAEVQPTRWPILKSAFETTTALATFSFANTLGDSMVLQAAPKQAMVFTVHTGGGNNKATIVQTSRTQLGTLCCLALQHLLKQCLPLRHLVMQ